MSLHEAYILTPYALHIFSHPTYLNRSDLTYYIYMAGADELARGIYSHTLRNAHIHTPYLPKYVGPDMWVCIDI